MSEQTCVSHIYIKGKKLFPAREIGLLRCQNSSLSAVFKHENQFFDVLQYAKSFAVTFKPQ